ncbi:MAG TPA: hypothetical protein VJ787_00785 [Thermoleophilia bacterium]|nr:hypothetical protein [Thermoleophilia bacterium]
MTRRRLYFFLWIAAGVVVAIAAVVMVRNELAILRGPDGDFAGYWLSDDPRAQRVWLIEKKGDVYTVGGLRLGGRTVGEATLQGAELVASHNVSGTRWQANLSLRQDGERLGVLISRDGAEVKRVTLRRLPTPASPDVDWSFLPSGPEARTIEEGIRALELGIEAYRLDKGTYPPVDAVRPGGALREFVDGWPVDPLSDKLMRPGMKPGDYAYSLEDGGQGYTLTGLLPGGDVFVVP